MENTTLGGWLLETITALHIRRALLLSTEILLKICQK